MRVFIGNIGQHTTEKEIRELFEKYGSVSSVRLAVDPYSRRQRNHGFVEMEDTINAQAAIEVLNNTEFNLQRIIVDEAKSKGQGFRNISVKGNKHS